MAVWNGLKHLLNLDVDVCWKHLDFFLVDDAELAASGKAKLIEVRNLNIAYTYSLNLFLFQFVFCSLLFIRNQSCV